ncbi:MAG: cytochrome c oxidase subunit, partial [Humisphaera sp.]|nr:cytochrome c oxidase subunit [Humisphaera sp.]
STSAMDDLSVIATDEPMPRESPSSSSLLDWFSSVDHKRIGILYICTALVFLLIGGVEALVMRLQLVKPNNTLVSPDFFNQLFTMHGTTMIFLVGVPILVGFANYLVPLMIGARDVAFPRLNAFGFWLVPLGGILLHYSFLTGSAPNAGWFSYAPLSEKAYSSLQGVDYWLLALLVLGIGSVSSAINLIVTIVTCRAPGMSIQRVPLFTWMMLITSFLIVLAIPALNSALVLLLIDRTFGAAFFEPSRGGNSVLWQHYFWIFGHPEVYILALPAFGMISEVIPVFSRRPIFGYEFVAASTVAIGILSMGVWAHHMFAVGLGTTFDIFFAASSLLIAIPTGLKVFNWTATLWGGSIRLTVAMCFAIAFLIQFVIGGLTGVMFAVAPIDYQLTDTYFVVAHFHYVLFGGTIFALFAGGFYWFPKMTGRLLDERLGRVTFWLMVLGFNLTFFVQHFLGLMGMPRRTYTYGNHPGWHLFNAISTVGAFLMGLGVLVFLWNIARTLRIGKVAGDNPWDAFTLEWATTSPPPEENFAQVPEIRSRRPVWDMNHPDLADFKTSSTPDDRRVHRSPARLAAACFVVSEAMFFLLLITAYIVFNRRSAPSHVLEVGRAGFFTALLVASSVTLWFSERALRNSNRRAFLKWMTITLALGGVFLVNQALEYAGVLHRGVTISSNLFGSTFFTLTGSHGLHVFGGLIMLAILFGLAWRGYLRAERSDVLAAIGYYWHFVDVVWVVVFSVVYLRVLT